MQLGNPTTDDLGLDTLDQPPVAATNDVSAHAGKHWQAVETMGRRAAQPGDPARLIDDAAALLAETLEMPCAVSVELTPDTGSLQTRLRECGGLSPAAARDCGQSGSEPNASLAAYALASGRPVVVDDLSRESRFAEPLLQRHGVASALAIPLRLGDRRFGALIAADRLHHPLAEHERAFAETIGHMVSVTLARWRAERTLEEERRLSSGVLDTLDALVLTLDADWRILQANPACRRIAGYQPEELRDRSLWEFFAVADEADMLRKFLEELDPSSSPLGSEGTLRTKGDEERHIAWSFCRLNVTGEEARRFIATGVDVTEQRVAEARARRAETAASNLATDFAERSATAAATSNVEHHESQAKSPFGEMPMPINIERRRKPRRSYPYSQRVAPIVDGTRPAPSEFVEIECNDIAAGGFSYISDSPPISDTYVVALGCPPKETYLTAQITHVTRIQHDGKRRYLVGCNYVGRVVY